MSKPKVKDIRELLKQRLETLEPLIQAIRDLPKNQYRDRLVIELSGHCSKVRQDLETLNRYKKFNSLFLAHGWLAHDSMASKTIDESIAAAASGQIDEAEKILFREYDSRFDYFRKLLNGLPNAFDREQIIERAVERFKKEDYISCIPLIFMLADGFSNDVMGVGVFSKDADLSAWDAVVGLGGDFAKYIRLVTRSRQSFSQDELTLPLRNGILHGRDANYSNRTVAIKTWALLFAVRDLLMSKIRSQNSGEEYEEVFQKVVNMLQAYIIAPEQLYLSSVANKLEMETFQPVRTKEEWEALDFQTPLDLLDNVSPEYCIAHFLQAWKAGNYGQMAELVASRPGVTIKSLAGRFRHAWADKKIESISVVNVDETYASIVFSVEVRGTLKGEEFVKTCSPFIISKYNENRRVGQGEKGRWLFDTVIDPVVTANGVFLAN